MGTEIYMAPEMKSHTLADEQGDIWAYGCILYELLSGQTFIIDHEDEEEFIDDKIRNILAKLNAEMSENCIENSEAIIDLLVNVLKPNPKQRFSIEQILNHEFFSFYR